MASSDPEQSVICETREPILGIHEENSDAGAGADDDDDDADGDNELALTDRKEEGALTRSLDNIDNQPGHASDLETQIQALKLSLLLKEQDCASEMKETERIRDEFRVKTNRLHQEIEQANIEVEQANEQTKSLKVLLRNSETDRAEISKELEKSRDEIKGLKEATEVKPDVVPESLRQNLEEAVCARRFAENSLLKQQEEFREREAEAVALRMNTESQMEACEYRLEKEREDHLENSRKYKLYIDSMKAETVKKFTEMTENVRSANKFRVDYETRLLEASTEASKVKKELELKLVEQQAEIDRLEQRYKETMKASEQHDAAVKNTESEMRTVLEKKFGEAELHKRMRQIAKNETVTMAKKLEDRSAELDIFNRSMSEILIPRTAQIELIVKQIEWDLDSAIHSLEVQNTRRSFLSLVRTPGFTSEEDETVDSQSRVHVHSDFSEDMHENKQDNLMHNIDHADSGREASIGRITQSQRIGFPVELAETRVNELQSCIVRVVDALIRVAGKIQQVTDLGRKENSSWVTIYDEVRRRFENCFHGMNTRTPATQHVELPNYQH